MQIVRPWTAVGLWVVFFTYWAVAARSAQAARVARVSRSFYRAVHLTVVFVAFALATIPGIPILNNRILPDTALTFWAGVAVMLAGMAFAFWARHHLGYNWSGNVAIKDGHNLIRSGPYAIVRHPIYLGFIIMIIGSAIITGELRGAISVVLMAA